MKPFILKQHDKDHAALRALRDEEINAVSGGWDYGNLSTSPSTPSGYMSTGGDYRSTGDGWNGHCHTLTPNGDGGDDGLDA